MNIQTLKILRFLSLAVAGLVLACAMSSASAAGAPGQNTDEQAANSFRLNDKVITEYTAVLKNLIAFRKQYPEVAKQMDKDGADNQTIAQATAMIDKYPQARDAITRTGMSVTDYITCSFAVVLTGTRAMTISQGASASSVPSGVATDNLRYYMANKAKFDALSKLMAQMSPDSD